MFNVSALLLDDAFKSATPLINGVINKTLRQFAPLSDISQGSVAHTGWPKKLAQFFVHINYIKY